MPAPLERELITHAAALRALARDLVGDQHADDLVQDTAVEALQAPPLRPGPLGGWLATVLRHLASKHRRGERHRRQRELRAARPEALPPTDREVADGETLRQLTAALLELPPPYRQTLLCRYLQEQTPTSIARREGVAVETVKTRLKRGLAMLRQRLRQQRRDWRRALTLSFRFSGVLLMGTGVKVAAIAAVVLAMTAWWLSSGEPIRAVPLASTAAPAPAAVVGDAGQLAAATPSQRIELPPAPRVPAALAVLRGRCVDAVGQRLAGVNAAFRGSNAGNSRAEMWLRDHVVPAEIRLEQITGADGRFEFHFAPPPPFQFTLALSRPGCVGLSGRWYELVPDTTKDLGDLALTPGIRVRGRVLQADGTPLAEGKVDCDLCQRQTTEIRADSTGFAMIGADGGFVFQAPLTAGEYYARVWGRELDDSARFRLDRARQDIELALRLCPTPNGDALEGVVVDADDAPVARVRIDSVLGDGSAMTDDHGHFRLIEPRGRGASGARLRLQRSGMESLVTDEYFAWGRTDVRLRMQRMLSLEVQVLDDRDRPVTQFQLRLGPQWRASRPGLHEQGCEVLTDVARGSHLLLAEPSDPHFASSAPTLLQLDGPGTPRIIVHVARCAERRLRVQRPDGSALAGSTVELTALDGAEFHADLPAYPPGNGWNGDGKCARLLRTASTDAEGEVVLRGPIDQPLAVFVRGPGHVPTALADIGLSLPETLVVTVEDGATLRGRLQPTGAVPTFRRFAGLAPEGPLDAISQRYTPRIVLWRQEAGRRLQQPLGNGVAIDATGDFTVRNAAAGTWQVQLRWACRAAGGHGLAQADLGSVDLRDGEVTMSTFDATALLPGDLQGTLLLNGQPARHARVMVETEAGVDPRGQIAWNGTPTETDEVGAFHCSAGAGACRVSLLQRQDNVDWTLPADEQTTLIAGATVTQCFQVRAGTLRVHLTTSDGSPVAGVSLRLRTAAGSHYQSLPRTDEDGRTAAIAIVGDYVVRMLPRQLQDAAAWDRYRTEHLRQPDQLDAACIEVARVSITAAPTTVVGLRLPHDWDR